jgi:hypothetical protein
MGFCKNGAGQSIEGAAVNALPPKGEVVCQASIIGTECSKGRGQSLGSLFESAMGASNPGAAIGLCGSLAGSAKQGFVLGYLLFALAILAITTLGISQISGKQDSAKWIAAAKDKVVDQANVIITQLAACATLNEVDSVDDYGAAYPNGSDALMSSLICPGTSATLWDSAAGSFAPNRISGFGEWRYRKSVSGTSVTIYFYITAQDAQGITVLSHAKRRLGATQVNLSQTSAANDTMVVNVLQ